MSLDFGISLASTGRITAVKKVLDLPEARKSMPYFRQVPRLCLTKNIVMIIRYCMGYSSCVAHPLGTGIYCRARTNKLRGPINLNLKVLKLFMKNKVSLPAIKNKFRKLSTNLKRILIFGLSGHWAVPVLKVNLFQRPIYI